MSLDWLALYFELRFRSAYHYTPYSPHRSPENTHKLMGFYMEVLILGVIFQYMISASLTLYQPMTANAVMAFVNSP